MKLKGHLFVRLLHKIYIRNKKKTINKEMTVEMGKKKDILFMCNKTGSPLFSCEKLVFTKICLTLLQFYHIKLQKGKSAF